MNNENFLFFAASPLEKNKKMQVPVEQFAVSW